MCAHRFSGGHGGGETPVPIPNTVVKTTCADGIWGEAPWESRALPLSISKIGPIWVLSLLLGSTTHMDDNVPTYKELEEEVARLRVMVSTLSERNRLLSQRLNAILYERPPHYL